MTHLISTASGTSATPPFTTVGLPRYSSWTSHNAVRFHTPLAPFPSARGRTPWHVALSGAPLQSARTRAPLPPAPLRCPVSGPGPPAVDIAPWCQREQSLLACLTTVPGCTSHPDTPERQTRPGARTVIDIHFFSIR